MTRLQQPVATSGVADRRFKKSLVRIGEIDLLASVSLGYPETCFANVL